MIRDPVKVGILQDHSRMNDGISDFQSMCLHNKEAWKWRLARNERPRCNDSLQEDLKPLASLIDRLALATHFPGDAVIDGADPVIRSPHHLCEASGMAQLLIGIAAAAIWHARTGQQTNIQSISLTRCTICILRTSFSSRTAWSMSARNLSTLTACFFAGMIVTSWLREGHPIRSC